MVEKCFGCHGDDPEKIKSDFDMSTHQSFLKGGESHKAPVVPGYPDRSPLFIALTWEDEDFRMPPKERNRLTPEQVEMIRLWIEQGAVWAEPSDKENPKSSWSQNEEGVRVSTSGGLTPDWTNRRYQEEDLWAYRPVQSHPVPNKNLDMTPTGNSIDAFINEKLKEKGIAPAGPADRITLIRRATFDLTGLPPTPAQIDAFLKDKSPKAFEKVVGRLLDSPRYGEQWGKHWLDVVRYADTDGFSNDFERPNAWRYRDYVIRSFNNDKPYNRFIIEQLAGDELDPNDPEMHISVGFLRSGPWEHTGMSVAAVTRQHFLDDVTHHIGVTFLAQGLRCARCHDHKFDPVPTKDFYQMQAVFAPTQFAERQTPYLKEENTEGFAQGKKRIQRLLGESKADRAVISEKYNEAKSKWLKEHNLDHLSLAEIKKLPDDQRPPRFIGLSNSDLGIRRILSKRTKILERSLTRYEPLSFSVYNGPLKNVSSNQIRHRVPEKISGNVQPTHILTGGAIETPAEEVHPGVLSVIGALDPGNPSLNNYKIPQTMNRRLALAKWIASPDNPLTARVMVNRIWQYHFQKAIAQNPNNFGKMGKKPTHPELLDFLAETFVKDGWSIKRMHRFIMNSAVYQRAGNHREMEKIKQSDPDNLLLSYFTPRRLAAEEIRDSMLAVSGELVHELGGLPIRPEINIEVALQPRHVMGSVGPAYQPSRTPQERNRRTIYAIRIRGLRDPMLEVFNQPNLDVSCEKRDTSSVTPQVFTLFNSQNTFDRSLAMAHRIQKTTKDTSEQVGMAFRLAFGRSPSEAERKKCIEHVKKMTDFHRNHEPIDPEKPTGVKREMVEEMTGLVFNWVERLDIYEDYVPDLWPTEVEPEVRGLATLCQVLYNSNEFVYVY
ncbi:MAG: PSD1 domain-containing protein [Planctomycetes bacterium]|nr:PSD1 domain-containing protein [Planctomycetota bacterium]